MSNPSSGDYGSGDWNFGPAVGNDGPPPTADAVPESPLIDLTGISTDKNCPEGFGEAHITGSINYAIRRIGTYDDIRDRRGFAVGYWRREPKTRMKGAVVYGGEVRIYNQALGIAHRIGNKGGQLFSLYSKRIYVHQLQDEVVKIERLNRHQDELLPQGDTRGCAKGLARCVFSKMSDGSDSQYPKGTIGYLTSETFVRKNRGLYIRHYKNLREGSGNYVDLEESFIRIVEMGLLEYDSNLMIV